MKKFIQFEIANKGTLHVRYEHVDGLGLAQRWRILYASDLHLNAIFTKVICDEIVEIIKKERPDLVLLGGDLVENRKGLKDLKKLVAFASAQCKVGAVGGNHDGMVGLSWVRDSVLEAGGLWLENESLRTVLGNKTIFILGSLSQTLQTKDYQILCAHSPNLFPDAVKHGIDLMFAGHLHGCQAVFLQKKGRLYPGAFFYRWNGLRFTENRSKLFVSRGAADTLPIRWNCPREIIVCDLE